MSNQRGITLISLVITIIVLAILSVSVIVNTVGIDGLANKATDSKESHQVKEDREIIEIKKQEVANNNSGDIPKEEIKQKLDEIRFTPIDDINSYEELKCIQLEDDEFIVKCREHNEHYYKVTPYETMYLGSLKDIPIITIGDVDITQTEFIIPVTVKCENGIKNITLPDETKIDAKDYNRLDNGNAIKQGAKYTQISFTYSVITTGNYTFKATSLFNTTSIKTVTIGNEELDIELNPTNYTNTTVQATVINGSANTQIKVINVATGATIENWHIATEYTAEQNCTIYAREQNENNVSIKTRNIQNIDKLVPNNVELTTSDKTINSFKLNIAAKDQDATDKDAKSGIKEIKYYITQEGRVVDQGICTIEEKRQDFNKTIDIERLQVGTTYKYYVEVTDHAGNTYTTLDVTDSDEITTYHQYDIIYHGNGGTTSEGKDEIKEIKTEDTNIPIQNNTFAKTGYTFKEWRTNAEGTGTKYEPNQTYYTNEKLELYAIWEANTYTVAYNGNENTGGSTTSSSHTYDVEKELTANGFTRAYTVTYNHNYTGSTNTTKTATYTFKNWNTKADETGTSYSDKQLVKNIGTSGTVNLYAQWNSTSITYVPTRTGYTFGGWYAETECSTEKAGADGVYTPIADITLYAKWNINYYTVTCIDKIGSTSGTTLGSSTWTAAYGSTAYGSTKGSSTTVGEYYTGYYYSSCTNATVTTSGARVYRIFTAQSYTLTVKHYLENANDSNYKLETTTTTTKKYGTTITLANYTTTITNGTYDYGSLTASTSGGTAVTTTTMGINTTICLYYSRDTYTLTLSKGNYISTVNGGGTYKVDEEVTISATVNSSNSEYSYSWAGWTGDTSYVSSAGSITTTVTMPAKNITITANGTRGLKSYILSRSAGTGGSVSGDSGTKAYRTSCTVTATANTGYDFSGWYEGSTQVSPNSNYTFEMPARNYTLTAKFTEKTYTITYYANGGSGSMNSGTKSYGLNYTISSCEFTAPSGYTFKGWATSSSSHTIAYSSGSSYTSNSNLTLYAVWACDGTGYSCSGPFTKTTSHSTTYCSGGTPKTCNSTTAERIICGSWKIDTKNRRSRL